MSLVITAAWLSSLCLALMIIFDRFMVGDCYRNKPKQAWFVSAFGGLTIGLISTGLAWVYSVSTHVTDFSSLLDTTTTLLYPYGLLMVGAGALTMQVLYHYFHTFIPEDGHEVNETAIALWLASSPVWIFGTLVLLQLFNVPLYVFTGLEKAEVSWTFGLLMLVTVIALMGFEFVGQAGTDRLRAMLTSRYARSIGAIQFFTVLYTLVLSGALRSFEYDVVATLALLPFYFLGFAAGFRTMVHTSEREQFRKNWRRITVFALPILIAEIVGALVFFLEFFALSDLDPTLVNLIIAAHVVPVYLIICGLRQLRKNLEGRQIRRVWFLGLRIATNKLPHSNGNWAHEVIWLAIALSTLTASILYLA